MKTLGRILIILIAAAVVGGVTYAVSQTSAAQALIGQSRGNSGTEDRPTRPDFVPDQSELPGEMNTRPVDGPEGRGGIETLGRNLLKIAVIVATVQVLWTIGRRLRPTAASLMRNDRLNPNRNS